MATKYQIVQTAADGNMSSIYPTDIYAWAQVNGRTTTDKHKPHLRAELRDAPSVSGLYGPMWGGHDAAGNPIVRYEDQASYETLSS